MRNICKIWFGTKIFSLWKSLVYHQRAVEYGIFEFLLFPFTQISSDYCRKSYDGFWGLLVISPATQIFLIYTFVTMKLLNFFEICTDMHFVSLFFSKWKKHYNLPFGGTFKMYCFALCWLKFKLQKQALLKLRVVKYAISFFSISDLCLF